MGNDLGAFFSANSSSVLVTIATTKGSTPRADGAWMLVGKTDIFETIGGGQLEFLAIQHARKMLETGAASLLELPLGPEIGQCCGGFVKLTFETLSDVQQNELVEGWKESQQQYPHVYIFGAGHVGRALCQALQLLPVHIDVVDSRLEQLQKLPVETEMLAHYNLAMPESIIADAKLGSAFVILTHDHAQDFLITQTALQIQPVFV